jgi:hypothetical protein
MFLSNHSQITIDGQSSSLGVKPLLGPKAAGLPVSWRLLSLLDMCVFEKWGPHIDEDRGRYFCEGAPLVAS